VELLQSFGVLAIVAWLILRAFRQRALLRPVLPVAPPAGASAPDIAVIVPARNEAANIEQCLRCLIGQSYPADHLRIVVVDDGSADATAAIAAALAARHRQLSVLASPPLPPEWVGKSHACWIGARATSPETEWLCFLDADVRAEPPLLASAVAAASSGALDLLSLAPRQELKSFAERLVMPCGLYLLAFCQNLRKVQSAAGSDATATGQFMLLRRRDYFALGGHAAVRREICEDLALARLFKRSGRKVLLRDGSRLLSTRMYTGWGTLWPGIAKNLVEMLGGPTATIVTALCTVALVWALWLIPLADGVSCARGSGQGCLAAVPALLGAFGRKINALRIPYLGKADFGHRFWGMVTHAVQRRPVVFLVGSVAILVAAALPLTQISLGSNGVESLPHNTDSYQGIKALERDFSAGINDPIRIVVDGDVKGAGVQRAITALQQKVAQDPSLQWQGVQSDQAGRTALIEVSSSAVDTGAAAKQQVTDLRADTAAAFQGSGAKAYVTGNLPGFFDVKNQTDSAVPIVFAFVLASASCCC